MVHAPLLARARYRGALKAAYTHSFTGLQIDL